MTNANLQDAVDALGNSKLTGDTVYVLQPSHMRNLTPKAQEGFIQSIVSQLALEGRELDYTFITPLRDAIAKRRSGKRGRLCPSAVMEPVSFKEIRSDSSNRNMAVLGRNVYNELTQSYQHENRVDQIGFRYPGDSHYSVLVSLERNYTSSQNFTLTYHVTYLAASCLHKKDRARSVIRGEHAKFTYSYKSPGAAIDAVYAAPRVSPHAVARTIAWNNRHVLGRMQQYFSEKLHYARSDLMDKLRERDKQSALVSTLLSIMPGSTTAPAVAPELVQPLQAYVDSVNEIMAQQVDSVAPNHLVMVGSFGDMPCGFAFYKDGADNFKLRRIESLDQLPSTVVGRLQTLHINRPALQSDPHLAGVGALIKKGSELLREGSDCFGVLVTENELQDIFKDIL